MGTTLGRGGATTFQQDLQNADCILIAGSNMAECHPVGFRWVMKAKERGAKIIHVDPRFTRTSAVADIHVSLRAGSDIAFLGGIVRYILENERYFQEYLAAYTDAPAIVSDDFRDAEDLDGFFNGWDHEKGLYAPGSWKLKDPPERDETLRHPRCVLQILKRHFSRYTPEMVEEVCGVSREQFLTVARSLCDNSGREKTSAICYAVGWTQHSTGVQCIRTAAIIQLLLGNIGRPGGGILALRGHASIQGSTDIPTLYNLLPGYLAMPTAKDDTGFAQYIQKNKSDTGWWSEYEKYAVSLLKAWFGEAATPENGWYFDHLPRMTGDHSHYNSIATMADGSVRGYFVMGENPLAGSMHGSLQRAGLRKLEWMVVRDFAPTETAEFWNTGPEITRGEVRSEDIATEVFFFPAAAHTEKDGAFTNTQRMLQWHHKAIEPRGDTRSELHFVYHLGRKLRALYRDSKDPKDRPVLNLTWDYPIHGPHQEPDAEAVLKEIHGYTVADGKPVKTFTDLKADGSTACGCWIYSGVYAGDVNQSARRKPARDQSWVAPEWGWAWPANRRVLYNRASADPEGKPWSERKKYVWWNEGERRWTGYDIPDFLVERPPSYRPDPGVQGIDAISGIDPFVMQTDGKGHLFAAHGLHDGPLPAHYEPQESVLRNPLYAQQCNPARMEWHRPDNPYHRPWKDPRFPYVLTTYRLTEHHTAGGMSRWLSWLSELQPELFCEISPELAAEKKLRNGDWATLRTSRAEIEARVLVTRRMRPLRTGGGLIHQIGVPYHWARRGLVAGDTVNDLIGLVADPNVSIQESKAFTADLEAGRRGRGRRVTTSGPLVPWLDARAQDRDLPRAQGKPEAAHGFKAAETQEGDKD